MRPFHIPRLRLANHSIASPSSDDPAAVVRRLGAVQAQDYLASLWAIGLRQRTAAEPDIEAAVAAGTIVRTWPMRGTLHYVAAEDVRWMVALLAPRVIKGSAGRHRELGLDDAVFAKCRKVLGRALRDGPITRPALYQALGAARIATAGSRGLHILAQLAHEGLICFGPRAGKQPTLVWLDAWIAPTKPRAAEEALGDLAGRYFATRGPASATDFGWWAGLPLSEVRAAIALAGARLVSDTVGGRTYWRGAAESAVAPSSTAHLLPAFDEYTVAYRDRGDVLDPAYATAVNAGGGMLRPVIVVGGRMVGTWTRALGRDAVTVTLAPFGTVRPAERRMIIAAAERYQRFLQVGQLACRWVVGGKA